MAFIVQPFTKPPKAFKTSKIRPRWGCYGKIMQIVIDGIGQLDTSIRYRLARSDHDLVTNTGIDGGFQIRRFVTHHIRAAHIDVQFLLGKQQHSRFWLAAVTESTMLRMMGQK